MFQTMTKIPVDALIELVKRGSVVRTGIDIFHKEGRLLLQGDVLVRDIKLLENIKKYGIDEVSIDIESDGGLWDYNGKKIHLGGKKGKKIPEKKKPAPSLSPLATELERKIEEIQEIKAAAAEKYRKAKGCIKEALKSIKNNGGEFDFHPVAETVNEIFDFVNDNENAFSYLTREIFSYDDYLYNHSINVCTIGTVVMKKFNEHFSAVVNAHLDSMNFNSLQGGEGPAKNAFSYFQNEELRDISIGFFMHDMGKVLIDRKILNKESRLTDEEFAIVKTHSTSKGREILEKNRLTNPFITNISLYHHARLFPGEPRCYPEHKSPNEIAPYVKVCKLADIYDAMTSKRCYKEAINPVEVVTDIFHKYAEKDRLLQFILHSFVKSVGIYPQGSVVLLTNGQMAFVLDNKAVLTLLPITDEKGAPLKKMVAPIILDKRNGEENGLMIDRRKPPVAPKEAYKMLPDYLKTAFVGEKSLH